MASSPSNSQAIRWRWLLPVAALVAIFHVSPLRPAIDRAFFDASSRHPLKVPPLPPNSALVLVDEQTMTALSAQGVRWPFPRAIFAQLVMALQQAGAARIVVDFTFFEESDAGQDQLLAAVAAAVPSVVLARTQDRPPVFWPAVFTTAHRQYFQKNRTGLVEFPADSDGVARSYPVPGSLAAAVFDPPAAGPGGLIRWQGGLEQIKARGVPVLSAAPLIAAGAPILHRLVAAAPDLEPEQIAPAIAAEPALTGEWAALLRGRTVFIGANASGTFDLKPLPVGKIEPGLLLHWTAWTNLATGRFITAVPPLGRFIAVLLFTGAVICAGRGRTRLLAPVAVAVGLGLLLFAGAHVALSFGWFLPPATPATALGLTLLGVVAESYWREQARKREIQAMFGAYVDPGVVAQLVQNPAAIRLGGERREATVFFSDLVGFTDLSEKLKDRPELMVEVVNTYLDETSECLLNHGAYVDKYIGDAVMAAFGVPSPLPDHALAACRAALEAQRLIVGINARYAAAVGVQLAMRIGLNTGELIVGNVGSSRKKNYTVMGDTVNLASRLEAANKVFGTGILLGNETARRAQGVFATRPLARLRVKGKLEAIEVHALVGITGTLSAQDEEFLAAYRAGYAAYVSGRFAEAAAALTRADGVAPGDLTTLRLREESLRYAQSPPPAGWEPVLTLDSK
ncbi:MAG: CHASE2 domain-containing protein [Lacunisphaera sp.]|nr:CHASE2 domain-containing protein [Lacunisphaera sp.]